MTETPDGLDVTLRGYQRAMRRALELRAEGNEEAARMLSLAADDPARWEYARCVQLEGYWAEIHESGI
ncbi:hypothetical protein ACFYXS_02705 [Streptomyces sp. NPDC002574]|uniref:hypothetical protein n=1 Tax=Streptomyces sp. NPDC002574 TaxID=3364652 RepID=UPI0036AE48CA